MKQSIRWILFYVYWFALPTISTFLFFNEGLILGLILLFLEIILSLIALTNESNKKLILFLNPKLPKRVVDDFGVYYIKILNGYYRLYQDKGLYLKEISNYDVDHITNQEDLLDYIKMTLNNLNKDSIIEKSKKDILEKWDGYLTTESKRDHKIKQII